MQQPTKEAVKNLNHGPTGGTRKTMAVRQPESKVAELRLSYDCNAFINLRKYAYLNIILKHGFSHVFLYYLLSHLMTYVVDKIYFHL